MISHLLLIFTAATFLLQFTSAAINIDRTFLSGAADTTQLITIFPQKLDDVDGEYEPTITKQQQHHHVCYHNSITQYASSVKEGRNKCCFELYQTGLIKREGRQYCLDHIALVPHNSVSGSRGIDEVVPIYYLAQDVQTNITKSDNGDESLSVMDTNYPYIQHRSLKVYEDKEKETLHDGYKGVNAFSPFHLTEFTSDGLLGGSSSNKTNNKILPMRGNVRGDAYLLHEGGGMHREFHQRISLQMDGPNNVDVDNDDRSAASSPSKDTIYQMNINTTVLLPIMESIFIDADDPLLVVEYTSSNSPTPEAILCKIAMQKYEEASLSSKCNIQFIHPEVIDIEQPAFASRQYVVAYEVSATLDFVASSSPSSQLPNNIKIEIDYGTTLHIRYSAPIMNRTGHNYDKMNVDGLVPIVIQQPVLYSASATILSGDDDEQNKLEQQYRLQTDVYALTTANDKESVPPNPIIIHVPAGLDDDYWWVTFVTMASALIGGLLLMKSLDSVSIWC